MEFDQLGRKFQIWYDYKGYANGVPSRDGLLHRKWTPMEYPQSTSWSCLKKNHQVLEELLCQSIRRTFWSNQDFGSSKDRFYWVNCRRDAEEWCKRCDCALPKRDQKQEAVFPITPLLTRREMCLLTYTWPSLEKTGRPEVENERENGPDHDCQEKLKIHRQNEALRHNNSAFKPGDQYVSLGAFCAGTVLSWTSPALTHVLVDDNNGTDVAAASESLTSPGFTIENSEAALIGSTLTVGALISAIPTGYIADKFGRKPAILGLSLPFLLNYLLISFAGNLETVVAARFFAGLGLGGICVVAPMYIGEIAEPSNRGMFGSFFQMFLSCGILFTCIVGSFANWVWLAVILASAPVVFGGKTGWEEAERNLREFRGSNYDSVTFKHVVTNKANLKAVIAVLGVLAFQQLSGINAVVFYTANIFNGAGTKMAPNLSAIIINVVQVVVSYISILIVGKGKQKVLLDDLLEWHAAVLSSFPILKASLGSHVTFYMFAAVMAGATLFVYFVVPETRGSPLLKYRRR
ncbi:hypothetical protein NQ318_002658 [Aromia moschata]|uniref:Major facilitator superfamily (MFS) profile domain-containing protein n=1 Tax=Aromia moschata TaxID=1265417 RepID=A0AAV8XTS0_9CUCU|nr:hypothetical protein NQ318_002658 [Aromia moschata]